MATLTDLKDLVDLALGTPETVNFKALQELLLGIISHLTTLYKKFREKSSEDANFQTEFVKPSALRRKSYAGSFVLPPTSSPAPFSSPTDDQGIKKRAEDRRRSSMKAGGKEKGEGKMKPPSRIGERASKKSNVKDGQGPGQKTGGRKDDQGLSWTSPLDEKEEMEEESVQNIGRKEPGSVRQSLDDSEKSEEGPKSRRDSESDGRGLSRQNVVERGASDEAAQSQKSTGKGGQSSASSRQDSGKSGKSDEAAQSEISTGKGGHDEAAKSRKSAGKGRQSSSPQDSDNGGKNDEAAQSQKSTGKGGQSSSRLGSGTGGKSDEAAQSEKSAGKGGRGSSPPSSGNSGKSDGAAQSEKSTGKGGQSSCRQDSGKSGKSDEAAQSEKSAGKGGQSSSRQDSGKSGKSDEAAQSEKSAGKGGQSSSRQDSGKSGKSDEAAQSEKSTGKGGQSSSRQDSGKSRKSDEAAQSEKSTGKDGQSSSRQGSGSSGKSDEAAQSQKSTGKGGHDEATQSQKSTGKGGQSSSRQGSGTGGKSDEALQSQKSTGKGGHSSSPQSSGTGGKADEAAQSRKLSGKAGQVSRRKNSGNSGKSDDAAQSENSSEKDGRFSQQGSSGEKSEEDGPQESTEQDGKKFGLQNLDGRKDEADDKEDRKGERKRHGVGKKHGEKRRKSVERRPADEKEEGSQNVMQKRDSVADGDDDGAHGAGSSDDKSKEVAFVWDRSGSDMKEELSGRLWEDEVEATPEEKENMSKYRGEESWMEDDDNVYPYTAEGEDDSDEYNTSDIALDQQDLDPGHYALKQDFEDIVKRIETLENESQAIPGTTRAGTRGGFPDEVVEKLTRREKQLRKMIDMLEAATMKKVMEIQKELEGVHGQLRHLPYPSELYKSYFPSWKMLEDALCPHPVLREHITEVKEDLKSGGSFDTGKQLSKFLGPPGPSDRLLHTLDLMSELVERSQHETLAEEVAKAKKETASRQTSRTIQVARQAPVAEIKRVVEESPANVNDTDSESSMATEIVPSSMATTNDTGYLGFKMAKLGEMTLGIRKELDEMQLWRDRVSDCEEDIKELADFLFTLKRDMALKEEKDQDILTSLQMDMSEFQSEICGLESKKQLENRKEEMDKVKQGVKEETSTPNSIIIDREARIRTQQLQMQMNALHQFVVEVQRRFPDIQLTAASTGLPEDMQYPWGTGREGTGFSMRAGVGTTATYMSPPLTLKVSRSQLISPSSSPPQQPRLLEVRPTPLGGSEEKSAAPSPLEVSGCMGVSSVPVPYIMPKGDDKKMMEERTKMQQAITRLNTAQTVTSARLEAVCNQQASEMRRLQDLMTRMHRENLTRYGELQHTMMEFMGDEFEQTLDELSAPSVLPDQSTETAEKEGKTDAGESKAEPRTQSPPTLPQVPKPTSASGRRGSNRTKSAGSRGSSATVPANLVQALRKELMSYIKGLRRRLCELEGMMSSACLPEPNAAAIKRPFQYQFQCLSCDKRIDLSQQHGEGVGQGSILPELPRLAPVNSPPRLRNNRCSMPRVKPVDVYEIPRQCGGSYTATNKPRLFHYYTSLGDAIDNAVEAVTVERMDVTGTDGHIYKGQVQKGCFNNSNNYLRALEQGIQFFHINND